MVLIISLRLVFKKKKKQVEEEKAIKAPTVVVEKEKNQHKDLTNSTEFFLKNSLGHELVFKRSDGTDIKEREYREVSFSQVNQVSGAVVNGALPVLQQVMTAEKIAKVAPNGLFTTSVNIDKLSKFKDGSYSTMVRDVHNNLIGHEGFTKVTDIVKGNPIVAISAGMQALALVSSQYYLHEINTQLEDISGKLNELLSIHHDEKIGMLLTVKERLSGIASKENVDGHDINEIRILLRDTRNVFSEYSVRLSRQQEDLKGFKANNLFEKSRIALLEEKISDINFTAKMAFEADQLSLQTELSEIAVRMKLNSDTEILKELTNQLQEHYEDSFYKKIDHFVIDEYRPTVQAKYRELGKKYLLKHPDHLKQINDSLRLSELRGNDTHVGKLTQRIIEDYDKEQKLLYMPGDDMNEQRVFLEVENLAYNSN